MVGLIFVVPDSWVDHRRHFPIPIAGNLADLLSLRVHEQDDIYTGTQ
jgi:hypothetical protein